MRRKLLMLATVVALSSGSAAALSPELAEVDTMEDLVKLCTVKKGSPDYVRALSFCYGYGLGVYHLWTVLTSTPVHKPLICLPNPEPSVARAMERLVKWVKANPEYMKKEAAETVVRFLTTKWPCGL